MKRILPAAFVTLTRGAVADSDSTRVTSTRELAAGPERTAAVERAVSRCCLRARSWGVGSRGAVRAHGTGG